MNSIKTGHLVFYKRAILTLVFGCFVTGIVIGANIAADVFSAPIVFLFIIPTWLPLIKGIRKGIRIEKQS